MSSEICLYKPPVKTPEINIWMSFPAAESFGLAALGCMSIVKTLDMRSDYFVEKVFTDTENTKLKPDDVDVFGVSFSFDFDFLGLLKIFDKYKIPFYSKDRTENHPFVFGGGPALMANPEPYAEFFDFIIIGDAEHIDTDIIDVIKTNKYLPRTEVLKLLSKIDGVYIPSFTKYTPQTGVTLLDGSKFKVKKISAQLENCIATPMLSEKSFFSNTYVIEVERGCPRRCGFCLASYLNMPVRFCEYEKIIEKIDEGLNYTNKIALLGALITAHPDIEKICSYILKKKETIPELEMSVSSLRADTVSPLIIQTLVACGQKHSTIAIEAATERLRKVVNKNLTEEQIFETVKTAEDNGLKGLKIYAMIGLPTETKDDIEAFVKLAAKLKSKFRNFDFTFSFGTFVPKANTPFQYTERESTKSLEKKYEYLKKEFHKLGMKIRTSSVKWDYWQAVLSRGDRRLAPYLVKVYEEGSNLGAFKQAYKEMEKQNLLPPSDYFALKSHDKKEVLPWSFIQTLSSDDVLGNEYTRLLGDYKEI